MDNYDLTSHIVGEAVRELDEKQWWPKGDFEG